MVSHKLRIAMHSHTKIKKLSTAMSAFCSLIMIALPLWVIGFWYNFQYFAPELSRPNVLIDMQYIQPQQIVLAACIHLMTLSVLLYGIWRLRLLFKWFSLGEYFTTRTTNHLHSFTLALLISGLLKPIISAVLSVVLTWGNPPGQKALLLEFSSSEISMILIVGVLLSVTWVMREGQQLADENASFI